jgi:hypothetical protein
MIETIRNYILLKSLKMYFILEDVECKWFNRKENNLKALILYKIYR